MLLGLVAFGVMAWHVVTIERVEPPDAMRRLTAARLAFRSAAPLVRRDDVGRLVRTEAAGRDGPRPTRLLVLTYDASLKRLVSADVPIWFIRTKGPAAAIALRGTGFDLETLGLTADDLASSGVGLLLDEELAGRRILAWTQ
jgi:hypothetical protein